MCPGCQGANTIPSLFSMAMIAFCMDSWHKSHERRQSWQLHRQQARIKSLNLEAEAHTHTHTHTHRTKNHTLSGRTKPGTKLLRKLAMLNRVLVVSAKSTKRKVSSAIHRSPLAKPVKSSLAPMRLSVGALATCLKKSQRACPSACTGRGQFYEPAGRACGGVGEGADETARARKGVEAHRNGLQGGRHLLEEVPAGLPVCLHRRESDKQSLLTRLFVGLEQAPTEQPETRTTAGNHVRIEGLHEGTDHWAA